MHENQVLDETAKVLFRLDDILYAWGEFGPSTVTIAVHLPSWEIALAVLEQIQSLRTMKVELVIDFRDYDGYQYVFRP